MSSLTTVAIDRVQRDGQEQLEILTWIQGQVSTTSAAEIVHYYGNSRAAGGTRFAYLREPAFRSHLRCFRAVLGECYGGFVQIGVTYDDGSWVPRYVCTSGTAATRR